MAARKKRAYSAPSIIALAAKLLSTEYRSHSRAATPHRITINAKIGARFSPHSCLGICRCARSSFLHEVRSLEPGTRNSSPVSGKPLSGNGLSTSSPWCAGQTRETTRSVRRANIKLLTLNDIASSAPPKRKGVPKTVRANTN
jgi:hypothetical protein